MDVASDDDSADGHSDDRADDGPVLESTFRVMALRNES